MFEIVQQVEQLLKITKRLQPGIQATEDTITFDFRTARAPRRLKRNREWFVRYVECRGFQLESLCFNFPIPNLMRETISQHRRISFSFDPRAMNCANLFGIAPTEVDSQTRNWYKSLMFGYLYGSRMAAVDFHTALNVDNSDEAKSVRLGRFRALFDNMEREKEALEKFRQLGGFKTLVAQMDQTTEHGSDNA